MKDFLKGERELEVRGHKEEDEADVVN